MNITKMVGVSQIIKFLTCSVLKLVNVLVNSFSLKMKHLVKFRPLTAVRNDIQIFEERLVLISRRDIHIVGSV